VTTIYVTHDQVEAMTMGDRVAVMRKGELQQVADPQTLYDEPDNLFVGGFIGSPAMNMLDAQIVATNGSLSAKVGDQTIALGGETLEHRPALRAYDGRRVILGIRPEDLEDAALASDTPADRRIKGEVLLREALGSEILVHFGTDATPAETDETRELQKDAGTEEVPSLDEGVTMVGRFGSRSRIKQGEVAEVAVDTRALHFFDPETGLGIYESTKGAGS
jgi:multiple sugar transport system ATP-binding protein